MKKTAINPFRMLLQSFLLGALLFSSCNIDDAEEYTPQELGAPQSSVIVPATAGTGKVEVYSNLTVKISVQHGQNWLSLKTTQLKGDGEIDISYKDNEGFPRMAAIYLDADVRKDTIYIKQEGSINPVLELIQQSKKVDGVNGETTSAELNTNLDFEDMEVSLLSLTDDEPDWISDIDVVNSRLVFTVDANPHNDKLRKLRITLKYIDGWNENHEAALIVTQSDGQGNVGTKMSFDYFRSQAKTTISEEFYIEGTIISENGNPNTAMNPRIQTGSMDRTMNNRTAYILGEDGTAFAIQTATEADNTFRQYSKVQILLKGAFVEKLEDPDRYILQKIDASMVVSEEAGTPVQPVERKIGELTDADMFTYVKLKDCELPIREGAFTPINEGYGYLYNAYRIGHYPLLVRDIYGDWTLMNINLEVPYRRNGTAPPQGSGDITGILVHDDYKAFDGSGKASVYQIRPLSRDGIGLEENFANGFSEILAEWTDWNPGNGNMENLPSTGQGSITHSSETALVGTQDYRFLGPIKSQGEGGTNDDKGQLSNGGFRHATWWDANLEKPYAWVVKFSTAAVTTDQLSMQFTTANYDRGAPRYWTVEWSEDGNENGTWEYISEYSVPDLPNWSNTLFTQLPGLKNINVKLPLEMLGKTDLYIRMRPTDNEAGDDYDYDGKPIAAGKNNAIGYLSIRYNK